MYSRCKPFDLSQVRVGGGLDSTPTGRTRSNCRAWPSVFSLSSSARCALTSAPERGAPPSSGARPCSRAEVLFDRGRFGGGSVPNRLRPRGECGTRSPRACRPTFRASAVWSACHADGRPLVLERRLPAPRSVAACRRPARLSWCRCASGARVTDQSQFLRLAARGVRPRSSRPETSCFSAAASAHHCSTASGGP